MERVTKRETRGRATSPGDHPGKTVLHSLELEHFPNCDTMQQGVTVVKPTGIIFILHVGMEMLPRG